MVSMDFIYLAIPLASLIGAIIAGFFGKKIGRSGAHCVTIIGVSVSFVLSLFVLKDVVIDHYVLVHPGFSTPIKGHQTTNNQMYNAIARSQA